MERETGLEPATSSLGSLHSTTELLPLLLSVATLKSIACTHLIRHVAMKSNIDILSTMAKMDTSFFKFALLGVATLSLTFTPLTEAQQSSIEQASTTLYDTIMSPYCPGRTLGSCPSPQAREMRHEINRDLQAGKTVDAIKETLVQKYGPEILGTPERRGFGLFAWFVPVAFLFIGCFIVVRRAARAKEGTTTLTKRELERVEVERELSKQLKDEVRRRVL